MFDILGIHKFVVTVLKWGLKYWKYTVIGIVAICAFALYGCTPNTGTELKQSQMALATKNNVDSSQEDNRQDNSIALQLPDFPVVGPPLPPVNSNADETVKIVEARADEREKIIRANAELEIGLVRAKEEKWRLMVWVVGIGAIIVCALALLVKSPVDWKGKS